MNLLSDLLIVSIAVSIQIWNFKNDFDDSNLRSSRLWQTARVDYRLSNRGPSLPTDRIGLPKKSCSTTKLYSFVDSKICSRRSLFCPLYRWGMEICRIRCVPNCFVESTPEGRTFFVEQLKIAIKESLHDQRKVDSITCMNAELPIQRKLFDEIASLEKQTEPG